MFKKKLKSGQTKANLWCSTNSI